MTPSSEQNGTPDWGGQIPRMAPPPPGMIQEYVQALRAFSPSLRLFFVSTALVTTAMFGIVAVLQNLFLLRLGFNARFIGLLLGVGQVVWAAAALPAGLLSNRVGLRNGIMLGQVIMALGLTLMLLVESQPESLWRVWLMGSQGLLNLGVAIATVNIPPYLMAVTGEQERRYAFAAFQALIPATVFLGSLIAGLLPGLFGGWLGVNLDEAAPYRLAMGAGPVLLFLALVPLYRAEPARVVQEDERTIALDAAPLKWLLFFGLLVFTQAIGEGAVRAFFNVYLDTALDVPTAQIGTVMGVGQLLPIAAALAAPLLIARLGTGYALAAAALGIGLCLLPLAAGPGLGSAALSFVGVMAMVAIASTSRDLFGQEMVTPRWRTASQAVAIIGLSLGWAAAGVVGGILIDTVGFEAMFLVGVVSALASVGLLVGFLRRQPAPGPAEAHGEPG